MENQITNPEEELANATFKEIMGRVNSLKRYETLSKLAQQALYGNESNEDIINALKTLAKINPKNEIESLLAILTPEHIENHLEICKHLIFSDEGDYDNIAKAREGNFGNVDPEDLANDIEGACDDMLEKIDEVRKFMDENFQNYPDFGAEAMEREYSDLATSARALYKEIEEARDNLFDLVNEI